jgi:hypothetical protein
MANSTTIIIKITKGPDGYGRAIEGHTAINRKKKRKKRKKEGRHKRGSRLFSCYPKNKNLKFKKKKKKKPRESSSESPFGFS